MSAAGVAAVASQMVEGVTRQTRPPDAVFTGADALARARRSGARLIWLLATGADPHADALERLLDAAALFAETPATIIAGLAVSPAGVVLDSQLPGWDTQHPDLVSLVQRRLLPIRHTTCANCLADIACCTRHRLPDERRYGRYAATEWSARAIRAGAGYFTPFSTVELDVPVSRRDAVRSAPPLVRAVRAGIWTGGEALDNVSALVAALWCARS
jgi:hypothetical protein